VDSLLAWITADKWGQTTFKKYSENEVCPLFITLTIKELATGKTLYWRPGMKSVKEVK
jgi:hypothetical protein